MTIAEALRDYILDDGTLGGLIAARMYPVILPQAPTFPALTYAWISTDRPVANDGPCELSHARIQFDCWALTYKQAAAVSEALRLRLDGFSGVVGGSPGHRIQGVFIATEQEFYEPEPKLHRRSVDYFIHHEEEV